MASKIENWMVDVLPGDKSQLMMDALTFSPRELAIVTAGVRDLALAELIEMRFVDGCRKEAEAFIGSNGDGRAPASSFGSRIQLAVLLGLIRKEDAAVLRAVKKIRNLFAHTIKLDFKSPSVLTATDELITSLNKAFAANVAHDADKIALQKERRELLIEKLGRPRAALVATYTSYQRLLAMVHPKVRRIRRINL